MNALVAALAGVTVLLLLPRRAAIQDDPGPMAPPRQERALLMRLRPVLCLTAACGGWAMVGGPIGLVYPASCINASNDCIHVNYQRRS